MTPSGEPSRSPFLEVDSFPVEPSAAVEAESTPSVHETATPFRSVYESNGQEEETSAEAEELVSFLAELHDDDFDEAVFQAVNEAASAYDRRFERESAGTGSEEALAAGVLEEPFAPLTRETEALLEALAAALDGREASSIADTEIDSLVDHYAPAAALAPSVEHLFGGLKKKLKKIAKKAVSLAKRGISAAAKLGLGPILKRLKPLIRPLLKRVLRVAINRLPRRLRPLAQRLAKRLPLMKEAEVEAALDDADDASEDVARIQQELDLQVAELLFARDALEQEMAVAAADADEDDSDGRAQAELDRARARFVGEIAQLREGEDPTPQVERFIPALLPALKLAITLAKRPRVVSFIARLVAKLIQRFVGRRYAPALSRALVDAGLRLINLEATPDDEARAAGYVTAQIVEEVVRQAAAMPEHVLDSEEMLEGAIVDAFEKAAAANAPPVLNAAAYERRPDLRESTGAPSAWIWQPLRGPKRYKKHTRIYDAVITPHSARSVTTFGGHSLAAILRDRFGLSPGSPVMARVHLYEAIPGTLLPQICRLERSVPGLGLATANACGALQPLTPIAAAVLLGQPALGRAVPPRYLAGRHLAGVGQRYYYLEIPGARVHVATMPNGSRPARRSSQLHLTLDFPGCQARAYLFLGEADAQEIAVTLRGKQRIAAVMTGLRSLLDEGLRNALSAEMGSHVTVVHEAVSPEQSSGLAVRRLLPVLREGLRAGLGTWLARGLTDFLQRQPDAFVRAAEDQADGVTVVATIDAPPGLSRIREALRGKAPLLRRMATDEPAPAVSVRALPGFHHA